VMISCFQFMGYSLCGMVHEMTEYDTRNGQFQSIPFPWLGKVS